MTAMSAASTMLHKRQDDAGEGDSSSHWWYSDEGTIVKWSVFLGILVILIAYLAGGYIHARRRLTKGLPPLPYHRWMVRRHYPGHVLAGYGYHGPRQYPHAGPGVYRPSDPYHNPGPTNAYGMQNMAPPPPMYDSREPQPPVYSPPEGGSKVDPSQGWGGVGTGASARGQEEGGQSAAVGEFAPPEGPPPGQGQEQGLQENGVTAHGTGSTNPFRR